MFRNLSLTLLKNNLRQIFGYVFKIEHVKHAAGQFVLKACLSKMLHINANCCPRLS